MLDTLKKWVPITYDAFMDYRVGGTEVSAKGKIIIQKLILRGFNTYSFDFVASRKGIIDDSPSANAFKFSSYKSRAFTWFYMKKINNFINIVIISYTESFSYV